MTAELPNLADATYRAYRTLWKAHVASHGIAAMPAAEIRPETVEAWLRDRRASGAGDAALRKTMAVMQTVFERAVRYDRIPRNPVKAIKKPSAKPTSRPRPISPAAVEEIRAQLDGRDGLMVAVLAYTGVRPGEARGLKWGDVGERRISIERAIAGDGPKPTKTDAMRTVPLPKPLAADLAAVRGDAPDDSYVFARADGRPWNEDDWRNWRKRRFTPAAASAGVKISRPYDLRHAAVSLWLHEQRTRFRSPRGRGTGRR